MTKAKLEGMVGYTRAIVHGAQAPICQALMIVIPYGH